MCCYEIDSLHTVLSPRSHAKRAAATSSVSCQHKDRAHSQVYVLIHEDRIENPLNACSVAEYPHGTCSPSHLPEPPLNGIGRPDRFTKVGIIELKTGKEILEIIPQTLHGLRARVDPRLAPPFCMGLRLGRSVGRIDLPQAFLDRFRFLPGHLIMNVPDLIGPAPLNGNRRKDLRENGNQPLTPISTDDFTSGQPSVYKIGEKDPPFSPAFGPDQMKVNHLFFAIMTDT